jgi:AraC-like DNA-binding protein
MSNESEQRRLFDTLRVLARSGQQLSPGVVADIGGDLERRVVEFCLRNGRRHLTTEDVAEWFGEHRRTLEHWVGKRTGQPISFWLNEGRARYAYARHEDGLSYTRIAHEMGYASSSSVGMLLVRWRRRRDGSSHA